MTGGRKKNEFTPLCSIAAVSGVQSRAAVTADIQRQRAVGARGGVIVSAAVRPSLAVCLYIRRRRAIHLDSRARHVAARKITGVSAAGLPQGIPRGDDRDGLADFRFGESVAVVIHRRSERYLRRLSRRMGVLQADKIELFIHNQRADAAKVSPD